MICVFILASNAIVVISASGVAAILISQGQNNTLSITGHLKPGLPDFKPPDFSYSKDNITITASTIFSVSSTYITKLKLEREDVVSIYSAQSYFTDHARKHNAICTQVWNNYVPWLYVKNIYRFMFKIFNGLGSVSNWRYHVFGTFCWQKAVSERKAVFLLNWLMHICIWGFMIFLGHRCRFWNCTTTWAGRAHSHWEGFR